MSLLLPMTDRDLRLAKARACLRHADRMDDATLREACLFLMALGDWIEAGRARALLDQLDREAAAAARAAAEAAEQERLWAETVARAREAGAWPEGWEREVHGWSELARAGLGVLALFLILFGGLWLLAGFGLGAGFGGAGFGGVVP
jgi:hypothetical protein